MDIKVSKYTKDSTLGATKNGKVVDGEVTACRFYCFIAQKKDGDDMGRVKVHCDTGEPDFKAVSKEFAAKGVTVTAKELQEAWSK